MLKTVVQRVPAGSKFLQEKKERRRGLPTIRNAVRIKR